MQNRDVVLLPQSAVLGAQNSKVTQQHQQQNLEVPATYDTRSSAKFRSPHSRTIVGNKDLCVVPLSRTK